MKKILLTLLPLCIPFMGFSQTANTLTAKYLVTGAKKASSTSTPKSPAAVCVPVLDCTDGDLLTNVTFAGINNTTTCSANGYGDYTSQQANVEAGQSYPFSATTGSGWTSESVSVWIDYNSNDVFEESEFSYIGSIAGGVNTASLSIPAGTADGNYKMRVRVAAVVASVATGDLACDELQVYGETEDYTVVVGEVAPPAEYCGPLAFTTDVEPITFVGFAGISNTTDNTVDGTPAHEYFLDQFATVKPGETYQISLSGNTVGTWTNRFAVFADWNQDGDFADPGETYEITTTIYNTTGADGTIVTQDLLVPEDALPGTTRLRVKKIFGTTGYLDPCVGASYGQAEDYSITVQGPIEYCGPLVFTTDVEPITYVGFAGISNTTDNTVDGTPSHEFFLDQVAQVNQGESYQISLSGNTVGTWTNRFAVFIDWNQDGDFADTGETYEITTTIYNTTGADGTIVTQNLAVPPDALPGETRMRVKKIFGTTGYLDPCLGASYGQAEDYTVNVSVLGVSNASVKASITAYPNPVVDVLNIDSASKVSTVQVYDMAGKLVGSYSVNASKAQVNLSKLSAGVYIARVITENGLTNSVKVIKK